MTTNCNITTCVGLKIDAAWLRKVSEGVAQIEADKKIDVLIIDGDVRCEFTAEDFLQRLGIEVKP